MYTLRRMFSLIRDQRKRLIVVILINAAIGLFYLVPPYVLKLVINALIEATGRSGSVPLAEVASPLLLMAGAFVIMTGLWYIQERISDVVRLDTIIQLRHRLFEHILDLSIDYYETHRVGEIVHKITDGVYEFGTWLQEVSETVLQRILIITFSIGVISYVNLWAGLVILLTTVVKLAVSLRKKQSSRPPRNRARQFLALMNGHITEIIQNMTTLRSFGGEQDTLSQHKQYAQELRDVRYAQHKIEWHYNVGINLIEFIGQLVAFVIIAQASLSGEATPGDILLVALYVQQVMTNLRPMARFIDVTAELVSTCEQMLEILDTKPTVVDHADAKELKELKTIEFKGVGFTYPGHKQVVLKDVSFELEPGQMVALVGPSGTGKTTIVKLLLRLYEPTEGQILVNGEDITRFTGASLRKHIGTVMQDVALFNDSFADNIRLAKAKATRAELERAVGLAHAEEFVAQLPEGYETIVGERGIKLSGGQKQRVAIARAILKEPDVVILDEATSALDSTSEQQVQKGLNELLKGRMSVVIAHRLSTVKHANEILVIEKGRITERGNHDALIKHKGTYAHLFELQSQRI